MYGLPLDIDLSFFVGLKLAQVAIGENEIIFLFEPSASLNVQGEFELVTEIATTAFDSPPAAAQRASDLLGHSVVAEAHSPAGDLVLTFDEGTRLRILDSSKVYESYEIQRAGDVWIV